MSITSSIVELSRREYDDLIRERDAAVKALAELVACKDLKDTVDAATDHTYVAKYRDELADMLNEYKSRKPLAWAAARAALSAGKGEG